MLLGVLDTHLCGPAVLELNGNIGVSGESFPEFPSGAKAKVFQRRIPSLLKASGLIEELLETRWLIPQEAGPCRPHFRGAKWWMILNPAEVLPD